jgi:hypothetical protein
VIKQRDVFGISFNHGLIVAVTQMRLAYERREESLSADGSLKAETTGSTRSSTESDG